MKSRHAIIHSTGRYLPEKIVHNDDLDQFPDTAKYLISQKTGVFARRHAGENECTSDLAARAAISCIDKSMMSADGSWWPEWVQWLTTNSESATGPPPVGNLNHHVLGPAPGTYVLG
jgi:hypothetical protein